MTGVNLPKMVKGVVQKEDTLSTEASECSWWPMIRRIKSQNKDWKFYFRCMPEFGGELKQIKLEFYSIIFNEQIADNQEQ